MFFLVRPSVHVTFPVTDKRLKFEGLAEEGCFPYSYFCDARHQEI